MLRLLSITALYVCLAATLRAGDEPAIKIAGIDGALYSPLDAGGKRVIVLIFITHDCPIANGYAPEINRICSEYAPKNVAFYLVHVDPDLTLENAKKHARDYGFVCPVLLDSSHVLVQKVKADTTPEAVVLSPAGESLYFGRIDDRYADLGKQRVAATRHDLRDALDAILSGKTVATPRTEAVGCFITEIRKHDIQESAHTGEERATKPSGGL